MKIFYWLSHRYIFCCFIFCFLLHTPGKAQVNNTGNVYISGNVYMNTTFTNASTASYQNDGTLYLTGDFTNNQASMVEGSGATQFIGSAQQKINGSQSSVFHDVLWNNAGGVLMALNTTMGGTLSPATGSLFFNGYMLSMGGKVNTAYTNASAFNVTSTSDLYIYGNTSAGNGLYFDPAANTIHNITVSSAGTGTLGNALNVTPGTNFGTVIVDGSFNAAGYLTLKSDSNGTARVGISDGNITNNVTVERYIPPRRAWRFFCAPINNDTLHIRSAWQEGVNNPTLYTRYDPHPGYGTHITGDNNLISSGYDYNTTYNPSLRTWNNAANNWDPYCPSTVYTLVNDYDAYYFFIRGSRAVDLALATSAIADPTVIRTTGKLNNKTWSKTYTGLTANNWLLIPNPYASTIDIAPLLSSATGIYSNKFWVFDPKLSGVYGVGGYVVYDNGIMVPPSPSYPAPTTLIQAEQAFMVQVSASSASFTYKQNYKTSNETNVFGFTSNKTSLSSPPAIYANLLLGGESSHPITDGIAAGFGDNFSDTVDADDAEKRWGYNENIAFIRNNKTLAIELRPFPKLTDTLFLKSYLRQVPYIFQFYTQNFQSMSLVRAWLVDKYLNTKTELNLHDTTTYSFTPNADVKSYLDRFMIVFNRQLITNPVPVSKASNEKDPNVSGIANTNINIHNVAISPNPVTTLKNAMLRFNNLEKGEYEISIYSSSGQKLFSQKIQHGGGNSVYQFASGNALTAGVYTIRIINETSKESFNLSLIITN